MQTTKLYLTIITLCLCSIGAVAQPKDIAPAATSVATSASVTAPIQPTDTICPKCKERETNIENLRKAQEEKAKAEEEFKKAEAAKAKSDKKFEEASNGKKVAEAKYNAALKAKTNAEKDLNAAEANKPVANEQVQKEAQDDKAKAEAPATNTKTAQTEAEKRAADAKTALANANKQLESAKTGLTEAEKKAESAKAEKGRTDKKFNEASIALANAEEKVRIAEKEVEIPIKKGELEALKADISQKEAQIKSQKEHIAALTQKNSNQSTEIEAQKQKIEELNGLVKEYNLYKKDVDFVDKQFATLANIRLSQKFNKEKIEDAKSCFEMMHGTKYNLPQLKVLINCYEQSYRDFQNILKEAQKDILRNSTYSPAFCDQYKNKYIAKIKGMSYYTKHYSANWTIEYLNAEINKALAILSKHSNDSIADFTELIDNDFK